MSDEPPTLEQVVVRAIQKAGDSNAASAWVLAELQRHGLVDVVSKEQWKADCELLLLGCMYGCPPGGWSDPDRKQDFLNGLADIERRLRETA